MAKDYSWSINGLWWRGWYHLIYIYDCTVLRKTKQQYMDTTLSVNGTNSIGSIISLKYEMDHNGTIHYISSDPFFVYHWLPLRQHIYKTKLKKNWDTIYVDAIGSLTLPVVKTTNEMSSAHIFLYQIITEVEEKTVPISQQLSEKQDMMTIYYWLSNWTNIKMKIPNDCVYNYSKALLGAITRTFCKRKSLQEYIDTCFRVLTKDKNILSDCYVRVDVAHMVHMICRWKCSSIRIPVKFICSLRRTSYKNIHCWRFKKRNFGDDYYYYYMYEAWWGGQK